MRRQHLGGEPAGLADDGIDEIVAEIIEAVGVLLGKARGMAQREEHILDRRPIGHRSSSPRPSTACIGRTALPRKAAAVRIREPL